jgi:hypothetical protein
LAHIFEFKDERNQPRHGASMERQQMARALVQEILCSTLMQYCAHVDVVWAVIVWSSRSVCRSSVSTPGQWPTAAHTCFRDTALQCMPWQHCDPVAMMETNMFCLSFGVSSSPHATVQQPWPPCKSRPQPTGYWQLCNIPPPCCRGGSRRQAFQGHHLHGASAHRSQLMKSTHPRCGLQ